MPVVWIYAVLTLIQTKQPMVSRTVRLDICRINSYSNSSRQTRSGIRVWIYAVLTLIQTLVVTLLIPFGLDICRINSYLN